MLEKDLVADIKKYLKSLGSDIFFWKEHGSMYGTNGVPDIICCYKGRFLGMECKIPGGVLTELQKRAIEKINKAGGIARRVESVEDAKAIIRQADEERERVNVKETDSPAELFVLDRCLNSYQRAELVLQYESKLGAEAKKQLQDDEISVHRVYTELLDKQKNREVSDNE